MTPDIAIVLAITAVATVLFVTEWVRYDVTAIAVAVALLLSGVLELPEVLSGLSNPATVAIGCMLGLSAALDQTGAMRPLTGLIGRLAERSRPLAILAVLLVVAAASSFVNNTAVVVLFIPVIIELAPRLGEDASRLLMPLSFISIVGGTCTLIGTSTNLLVSAVAEAEGLAPMGMFEMLPLGAILLVIGLAYIWIGRRFLPARRGAQDLTGGYDMAPYVADAEVAEGSPLVGCLPGEVALALGAEPAAVEIVRGRRVVRGDEVRAGDVLRLRADPAEMTRMLAEAGLRPRVNPGWSDHDFETGPEVLVEAVVIGPALTGRRLSAIDFPRRFGALPFALRRRGGVRHVRLGRLRLRRGDCLLLRCRSTAFDELNAVGIQVISELSSHAWQRRSAPIAAVIMLGVVLATAFDLLPAAGSTLVGLLAMLLTGCLRPEKLYTAIDWKVLVLLAGVIPLGVAIQKSGAAGWLAEGLLSVAQTWGPQLLLAAVFAVTNLLTNLVSNAAAAAMLTPIAMRVGEAASLDPRPLVMAVAFGASLAFATPIGYQTNTLIYGPGNYRFADYLRFGGPLTLLCAAAVALLAPWIWPLH